MISFTGKKKNMTFKERLLTILDIYLDKMFMIYDQNSNFHIPCYETFSKTE